ncbi:hypothetical protein N7540_005870 [Penicillium herquei]|nr:hypothetical protein N7540_005870 [Penicillium herquei]
MFYSGIFVTSLLFGSASASRIQKRWTNGDAATGTTDPNVTNDCTYWANNIETGDTCESLEAYFGMTQAQLIAWNPDLSADDCILSTDQSYCVSGPDVSTVTSATTTYVPAGTLTYDSTAAPTQSGISSSCTDYYLVQEGDTCYSIQDDYMTFTLDEFYSWNPSISTGCAGLLSGYYVCVAAGGSSTTVTASVTASATSTPSSFPTQTGVTSSCNQWEYVVDGTTCQSILDENDITLAQFYSWNPAVGSTCANLWLDTYVCVGVSTSSSNTISSTAMTTSTKTTSSPSTLTTVTSSTATGLSPTQSGIASDCVDYYLAESGDSCWSIYSEKYTYLTEDLFIEYNPAVGSSCSILEGYYYCVAVTDAQPMAGTIDTCTEWHLVVSGDGCWAIEQEYDITTTDFTTWNPNVGSDCTDLWLDYYVCVGV